MVIAHPNFPVSNVTFWNFHDLLNQHSKILNFTMIKKYLGTKTIWKFCSRTSVKETFDVDFDVVIFKAKMSKSFSNVYI